MRPCGATRDALIDAGWECSGVGLFIVMHTQTMGDRLPVVLPRRALEIIDPEEWWETPLKDFAGGDHLHLVVPRRPLPPFRSDITLISGNAAMRAEHVGEIFGDSPWLFGQSD